MAKPNAFGLTTLTVGHLRYANASATNANDDPSPVDARPLRIHDGILNGLRLIVQQRLVLPEHSNHLHPPIR
jgi:hypothetical protein